MTPSPPSKTPDEIKEMIESLTGQPSSETPPKISMPVLLPIQFRSGRAVSQLIYLPAHRCATQPQRSGQVGLACTFGDTGG